MSLALDLRFLCVAPSFTRRDTSYTYTASTTGELAITVCQLSLGFWLFLQVTEVNQEALQDKRVVLGEVWLPHIKVS